MKQEISTPHKHKDAIIAWANGEKIQWRIDFLDQWKLCGGPGWYENYEYRVAPKEIKVTTFVAPIGNGIITTSQTAVEFHNLELTFDEDSGKLLSAKALTK